jgi:hypothetical protein
MQTKVFEKMEDYIVTIEYEDENGNVVTSTFTTRQKNEQYVKEAYHRYVHENYGTSVKRRKEQFHEHPLNRSPFLSEGEGEIRLKDISKATPIRQL